MAQPPLYDASGLMPQVVFSITAHNLGAASTRLVSASSCGSAFRSGSARWGGRKPYGLGFLQVNHGFSHTRAGQCMAYQGISGIPRQKCHRPAILIEAV